MPSYNPDKPMSNNDKMLTAGWFRRIADAIKVQTFPPDMVDYADGVANRCRERAGDLEKEVFRDRVTV